MNYISWVKVINLDIINDMIADNEFSVDQIINITYNSDEGCYVCFIRYIDEGEDNLVSCATCTKCYADGTCMLNKTDEGICKASNLCYYN